MTTVTENSSYGVFDQRRVSNDLEKHLEEIEVLGYTIVENVLSETEANRLREKSLKLYDEKILAKYGEDYLLKIQEMNCVRLPLQYDEDFLKLAVNPKVLNLVQAAMGEYVILHLQNIIINKPNLKHQQANWHRDLAYQRYITSKPFAISSLYCIDDFTVENGCTDILPFSHMNEIIPSDQYISKHSIKAVAKKGSAIVFNALLYHRAGANRTNQIRIGVNHTYVTPILKQQICIPSTLEGKYSKDPFYNKFLGYDSFVPLTDEAFKDRRLKKIQNN